MNRQQDWQTESQSNRGVEMENSQYKVLTASQAARLLNVHINTLRRWTDNGTLKSYRIGPRGDRRLTQQDIEHFVVKSSLLHRY